MLLIAVASQGQTVNYVSSTESFPNPERGFYHYSSTGLVSATTSYNALSASTLSTYRAQNITTVHRTFYLNQFTSSPISDAYLASMQSDFNAIRNAGLKVIIRFAYSKSETAAVLDATKDQIIAHINQVAPVISANKDVISAYQYGWIGCWGETYYSSQVTEFGNSDYENYTTSQWANRKAVMDAMLSVTPVEIPVQVRYVYHKQKMYPNGNDRIGFYNDAFLNVWGDSGTFLVNGSAAAPSTTDSNYLQTQTVNLPMTGETDALNAPRTDCANAMLEMNKYNWSLLNTDYLTANITNWTSQGCFSEIDRRLGYRFEMVSSSIDNNTLNITLQNTGFANLFKARKAYLVLRNTATNTEYSFEVASDLRAWREGSAIQISKALDMDVPTGTYQLYLNLPDPLISNPLYSIRCANVGTWDATKGYNNLNQTVSLTAGSTSTTPVVTTPTTPTVPSTGTTTTPTTTPTTGSTSTTTTTTGTTTTVTQPVQIILVSNTTIVINNLTTTNYTVRVYNLNGRLKASSTDVSGLSSGYYIVKVRANGTTYTQKIYKQ